MKAKKSARREAARRKGQHGMRITGVAFKRLLVERANRPEPEWLKAERAQAHFTSFGAAGVRGARTHS